MSTAISDTRRIDVEFLRVISAFGIVYFHSLSTPGREIAYAGLLVFVVLSGYFTCVSSRPHTVRRRAERLLIPCLIWSLVYAAMLALTGKPILNTKLDWLSRILATPSIHLWYLPYIFFVIIAIDWLKRWMPKRALCVGAGLMVVALLASAIWWRGLYITRPWGLYLHTLPAVCFGVFLAFRTSVQRNWWIVVFVLIAAGVVLNVILDTRGMSTTYLVGFAASCILLSPKSLISTGKSVLKISDTTFGVYVVHVLFFAILSRFSLPVVLNSVLVFFISVLFVASAKYLIPKRVIKYVF